MDKKDKPDNTEPTLPAEPTESTEATEPAEPIDRIDPAEPIDRIEPVQPIDRIDPLEPIERIEPGEPASGESRLVCMIAFSQHGPDAPPVRAAHRLPRPSSGFWQELDAVVSLYALIHLPLADQQALFPWIREKPIMDGRGLPAGKLANRGNARTLAACYPDGSRSARDAASCRALGAGP